MVDSHCHLDNKAFAADRDAVIQRAQEAGVTTMLAIGTGEGPPDDLDAAIRLADRYPCFLATVGVHPHDAAKATDESFARLRDLARHPTVVAIGEAGLDYHYNFSPQDIQQQVFVRQMQLALELQLPLVIHTREAWEDTFRLVGEHWPKERGGVFHCFSGGAAEMERTMELGFHIGLGGVLTFPKSDALREAARLAPAGRILLETDSPYLAPVPFRGKRCEPAHTVRTAEKLAEVRGLSLAEVDQLTTNNFARLFGTLH